MAGDGQAEASSSDEFFLEQLRDQNHNALAQLFRRYARLVRSVAYRIIRDEAEADDLVQEVFLFIFRKAALFDPARGSARSWLVQVTYHRAFDRRRHLNSRRFYSNLELDDATLLAAEPAVLTSDYEGSLEAALGKDALRRLEASLTEVQKHIFSLRYFDGYSFEEIAAILDLSAGNVRNHYYRGLERIRTRVFARKLGSK